MCCPPLIFKPSLGRREKLAEKVGRREIYRPVPPPSLWSLAYSITDFHMLGTGQKVKAGVGRSREEVGHEVLSLVEGVGRAIFSYP